MGLGDGWGKREESPFTSDQCPLSYKSFIQVTLMYMFGIIVELKKGVKGLSGGRTLVVEWFVYNRGGLFPLLFFFSFQYIIVWY